MTPSPHYRDVIYGRPLGPSDSISEVLGNKIFGQYLTRILWPVRWKVCESARTRILLSPYYRGLKKRGPRAAFGPPHVYVCATCRYLKNWQNYKCCSNWTNSNDFLVICGALFTLNISPLSIFFGMWPANQCEFESPALLLHFCYSPFVHLSK